MTTIAERYLVALTGFDWEKAGECLSSSVTRIGPFGDTYTGRDAYLAYLKELMPTLAGYRMEVRRVVDAGRVVTVELDEDLEYQGRPVHTPECLVFDIDTDGLIERISIYIQQLSGE